MTELFDNPHDALTFAFHYSTQQYALSPMAKQMSAGTIGSGKGMVANDGAGQAGMIQQKIESLTPLERHCIVARYAPKYTACPCCGSDKALPEWQGALWALRDWSMQFFPGFSHRDVHEAIIMSFYSRGVSMEEAAKRANVPVRTVYDRRTKIHERLRELDVQAQRQIADMLEAGGLIAGSHIAA